MAKVKLQGAIETVPTDETVVGAVATAYLTISATGNFVAGTLQFIGAASGKTKAAETSAEVASTATSVAGLGTLMVTGNLNKAATAAAIEGIVTSNPKDLATGGTVARAAKALDLIQSIRAVEEKIKDLF